MLTNDKEEMCPILETSAGEKKAPSSNRVYKSWAHAFVLIGCFLCEFLFFWFRCVLSCVHYTGIGSLLPCRGPCLRGWMP